MTVAARIRVQGISGYPDIYWPFADIKDVRGGYVPATTPKIGNDANADIAIQIPTWALATDLSVGAFKKDFVQNGNQYYLPVLPTSVPFQKPLAWTLVAEAPVMSGAAYKDISGAFSFKKIRYFPKSDIVMGIDTKGAKVYKLVGNTWTDMVAGLYGTPTDIHITQGQQSAVLIGQKGNPARRYAGAAWADYAQGEAQHFVSTGASFWYSVGNTIKLSGGTQTTEIGSEDTDINALLWYSTYILATKPEGLYLYDPNAKVVSRLFDATTPDADNGRTLILFQNSAWFNMGQGWFEYNGTNVVDHTFAKFDGYGAAPFYGGKVIEGFTDGQYMYLTYRVQDASNTYDYAVIYTGKAGGYHPVYCAGVATASLPAYQNGALFLYNKKLHASFADDRTVYLVTDGRYPLSDQANSLPFTKDVGITTGWFDAERAHLKKQIKQWLVTTRDYSGGQTGQVEISYQKWKDAAMTTLASLITGTQDNVALVPAPEGSNNAGFATTRINTQVMLRNTDPNPYSAWYLDTLHLQGRIKYVPAFQATLDIFIDQDELESDDGGYVAADILASAKAAIAQAESITITWLDGSTFTGSIEPVAGGDGITAIDAEENTVQSRKFMVTFREDN